MNEIGNYNMIETIVLQILKILFIKLFTNEFTTQLLHTKSPWKLKKKPQNEIFSYTLHLYNVKNYNLIFLT